MRSTFSILFYLKKSSVKKTGYAPLMARITINGESVQFSMKAEARLDDWDTKSGRLRGRTVEAIETNALIEDISSKIRRHHRDLCDREHRVTAMMVREAYQGVNKKQDTLLGFFDRHNAEYKTLVGRQTTTGTYGKYVNTRNKLQLLLKKERKVNDILLVDLTSKFVTDFERFLFVECGYERNTVMKCMQQFKRVVSLAHNNGMISVNPFASYEFHFESSDRGYLSEEELTVLMKYPVTCPKMETARDVFVFCCFTGLSYTDVANLREENIQLSFDRHLWILTKHQKTTVQSNVRLLPIPQQIIEKYKGKCSDGMVLPVPSNREGNKLLKKLGEQCGIATKITYHQSRHTFATTVTLGKGVPIESVSRMLGHKSVKTTQIYARIVDAKVSRDMDELAQKLGNLENVYAQTKAG
jgi:site-specific recombinase XerD